MTRRKKENPVIGILGIVSIVVLSIVFWLDDALVIGELLDPLQFILISVIGYYTGKNSK